MIKIIKFIFILINLFTDIKLSQNGTNLDIEVCVNKTNKYFLQRQDPYSTKNMTWSHFQNFNQFTDLFMNCNQTYDTTIFVEFRPNRKILVDKNFTFAHLINASNLKLLDTLVFSNVKGVDLNSKLIKRNINTLTFVFSEFNVYSNGTLLTECSPNSFKSKYLNLITTFKTIYFRQVIYPATICPLIFWPSSLINLLLTDITNSLLIKNRLRFDDLKNMSLDFKKLTLKTVYLELNYERLTSHILDSTFFKLVQSFYFVGILNGIDAEIFKNFHALKAVEFRVNNLRDFFHQKIKWMSSLNSNVNVNLSNAEEISQNIRLHKGLLLGIYQTNGFQSFTNSYMYADEEICLFKDFPHSHLVFPFIYPEQKLNCSCTLKWLHLYVPNIGNARNASSLVFKSSDGENQTNIFHECGEQFLVLPCDFEALFSKCDVNQMDTFDDANFIENDVDLFYLVKWIEYVLILILQPFLCSLSILANILIIVVISHNENPKSPHFQKPFKDHMYKYATINALFNIAYAILMLLKLMNTCVFSYSSQSYQCSTIYQDTSVQYFKIIGVYFLGNTFKTCSNISYLFFSLSRYISVSLDDRNRFFIKINKINIKLFFFVLLIFSAVLSLFILFQYEINEVYDYRKEFPFEKRDGKFCLNESNKFTCKLFNVFKMVNQSFNVIAFLILSLLIDIFLAFTFRAEMKQKSELDINKGKEEEFHKKTKKVTKMVLINSLVYFMSHAPVFFTTLLLGIFSDKMAKFCTERLTCDLINEEADVFILISMILNFFIFLYFNKNFNGSFQDLKQRISSFFHRFTS